MAFDSRTTGNKGYNSRNNCSMTSVNASIPIGYLDKGYTDESGDMDIKLITDLAEKIGKSLGNDRLTGVSKIRSFYDEVTDILNDCVYGNITWTQARNRLAMLKARANVRFEKGTASKLFLDFMSKNVTLVTKSNNEKDFKLRLRCFRDHFEAVVCYLPKK